MSNPSIDPVRDLDRLRDIAELNLSGLSRDPVLQAAVEEAAERLAVPTALVSIVLDEAQHFAAHHGLGGWLAEVGGSPVEWSFCANSVRSGEPFVVDDATTHPVVADNPLVQIDGIRCYAGVPLVSSRGHVVGNLCVIGNEVRSFSEEDVEVLRRLADQVVDYLESRRANG